MAGEIASLAGESRYAIGKLSKGVIRCVEHSFAEDKSRRTGDEERRRSQICIGIARELRRDLGWSVDRIVDELPRALRSKLDGIPWDPSKARRFWRPPSLIVP